MEEGSVVQVSYKKMKWTTYKTLLAILLIIGGVLCVLIGVNPLINLEFETKSFCNLIFVVLNIFYLFSFLSVQKMSDFIFWCSSFLLLIACSLMFYYYDEIFI